MWGPVIAVLIAVSVVGLAALVVARLIEIKRNGEVMDLVWLMLDIFIYVVVIIYQIMLLKYIIFM